MGQLFGKTCSLLGDTGNVALDLGSASLESLLLAASCVSLPLGNEHHVSSPTLETSGRGESLVVAILGGGKLCPSPFVGRSCVYRLLVGTVDFFTDALPFTGESIEKPRQLECPGAKSLSFLGKAIKICHLACDPFILALELAEVVSLAIHAHDSSGQG